MKEVVSALRQGHATYATGSEVVGGKGRVKNEQELRCFPFSVSCPGYQHNHPEIRTLLTHTYIRWATKYYGSDLDQTCGIQPRLTPTLLPLFPYSPFAPTALRASKWMTLPLELFLSNLHPPSLQISNCSILLLETLCSCLKFSLKLPECFSQSLHSWALPLT